MGPAGAPGASVSEAREKEIRPSCSEPTLEVLPGMVTCQTRTGWRKQATDSSMYARNFWKQPNQRAFSLAL